MIDVIYGSIVGSAAFAVLLLLKRPAQKRCGARIWQQALLIAVALFLIPVIVPNSVLYAIVRPVHEWLQANLLRPVESQSILVANVDYAEIRTGSMWIEALPWVWLAGAIVYMVARCALNAAYAKRLREGAMPVSPGVAAIHYEQFLTDETLNKFGKLRRVRLFLHDGISSPMVYGLLQKNIIFPRKLIDNYGSDDICLMLKHEVMHVLHNDSWKRLFLMVVQSANWFNPLLFLIEMNLNEAFEIYCDSDTLGEKSDDEMRFQYSDLLISLLSGAHRSAVMGLSLSGKGSMEKRLRFAMEKPKKPEKLFTGLLMLTISVIVFVCLLVLVEPTSSAQSSVPTGFTDYGTPSENTQQLFMGDNSASHDLSQQGEITVEMQLLPSVVNYVPIPVSTASSEIWMEQCAFSSDMIVYLYYSADTDYPLMQLVLSFAPKPFSGLLGDAGYVLGIIVDKGIETSVRLLISDKKPLE